jgi:4a-hydroxytetrahydrobiopterin dehydratase
MARLLDDEELRRQLGDLKEWSGDSSAISRKVEAPDFVTAIRILDAVAEVAEEMDHHPDMDVRWRNVTYTCSTHSAGGVTQLDMELAHRINEIASEHGAS